MQELNRRIYLTCDACYIQPLCTVVYSVLKNADPRHDMTVYIAHDQSFLDRKCQAQLDAVIAKYPFARAHYLNATAILEHYRDMLTSDRNLWSPIIWAGPLLTEVLPPDVGGRIIYLDVDMLVLQDLGPLFEQNLEREGKIGAAVIESSRRDSPYLERAEWPSDAPYYFNNGTLPIDLDSYRRERISERIINWYSKHKDVALCTDQDAQNCVFGNRLDILHPRWNYNDGWLFKAIGLPRSSGQITAKPRREVLEAALNPAVIHFVNRKPWKFGHRPERKIYHKYMRELGIFDPALNGRTLLEKCELAFYDAYYGLLKLYARLLLRLLSSSARHLTKSP